MTHILTPADLQGYIDRNGLHARLLGNIGATPTVSAAASVLGVAPEQIVKTLLFLVQKPGLSGASRQAVVVISNGESRVDKKPLAKLFDVGKKQVKLAPADVVREMLGYPAGGVPPFGHRTRIPTFLDVAILDLRKRFGDLVYGGGGDDRTMLEITVDELVLATQPRQILVLS